MKQSATAGCITALLRAHNGTAQEEQDVRVRFAPCSSSSVSPKLGLTAALRTGIRDASPLAATPTFCAGRKPIIRNSASTYSLGRSSVSVRFVEQPPVCRAGLSTFAPRGCQPQKATIPHVLPTPTQDVTSDALSSRFERTFDECLRKVEDSEPVVNETDTDAAIGCNSQSEALVPRHDRSRLHLDLPVQLSRMALSTMNGDAGLPAPPQGQFGLGNNLQMHGDAACVNCGRGFDADEPTTNVNGALWHAACFTSASNVPTCEHCYEPVSETMDERIVAYQGRYWHSRCFVCAQCFRSFKDGVFYEFDGRKYCEDDFNTLFAPCCKRCDAFITGRVIKAMNCNWHPACFCCEECSRCLADEGFVKNAGRALCKDCNLNAKASSKIRHVCFRCRAEVDDGALLRYKGEVYHAYHFKCHSCGVECNADAREKEGELFCLRCYDKMGVKICAACRRPIDERVVNAMGKTWHVEHFVCAKCEKPFLGSQHHEKKGQAYCTTHYLMLFGNVCFYCEQVISTEVVAALSKNWCPEHFACSVCDKKLGPKSKFYDFDLKPVCKPCYDKFPTELQKRLKKMSEKK